MLFTPEMSGLLDRDRKRAADAIRIESEDRVLATVRDRSAKHGIWTCLGSLAIDTGEGKWVNRSFVIDANGEIAARYDKIHMFDVDLASGETWRESSAYQAGEKVATVQTPAGKLGLAICYDLRFPALFEALGMLAAMSSPYQRHLQFQRAKHIGMSCREPGRSRPAHMSSQPPRPALMRTAEIPMDTAWWLIPGGKYYLIWAMHRRGWGMLR